MIDVVERPSAAPQRPVGGPDERPARRALLAQIERLEGELARLVADAWPRTDLAIAHGGPSARPRLRDLGELERIRDGLAGRVADGRAALRARQEVEDANRRLLADMRRDPSSHRWARVSHVDIGEPGCRHYRVVPRWGIVGMLADWWRVKVSSGCP